MRAIISAIRKALREVAQTALDTIGNLTANIVSLPFAVFGFGGATNRPGQDPVFDVPVSTTDLVAELQTGHQRVAAVRDLDRDGVRTVYEFAKASEKDRATYDLTPVRRPDVQALLIRMTTDQLTSLTLAGSGAVRRLVLTGNSGVSGVPMVPTAKVIEAEENSVDEQLAANLRALKELMAKPSGGSKPYTMPRF